MNNLDNIVFVIPSLNPDDKMPTYVKGLINVGVKKILLVDDGSKNELKHYFSELKEFKEVTVLTHTVNRGKGRALKTAFKYILENMTDVKAIVTADADGQHSVDDTIDTGIKVLETGDVVFGTRNFNEDIVPFKSRNGNKITTAIFKLLYGKTVNDTQTGLRGLPIDFIGDCLDIKGERFEYEIAMLIKIVEDKRKIIELPIKTIYFDSNRETHFNPFKDSIKIYRIMFKQFIMYASSSLLSALVDIGFYTIMINLLFQSSNYQMNIFYSTVIARICSSLLNFFINKNKVFLGNTNTSRTIIKYYILAILQMLASWIFVTIFFNLLNIHTSFIKIIVDLVLFFVSYKIQKNWVFKK